MPLMRRVPKIGSGRFDRGASELPGPVSNEGGTMADRDLELKVAEELVWEPRVDASTIAVSTHDGAVTLRGTVGSFRQKLEAKHAAERVYGVTKVENDLKVQVLAPGRREDAELRGDVLRALMLDSLVPATIDARVDQGFVTLTGTAKHQFERDEAEFVAGNVTGVLEVLDEVALESPKPDARDVKDSIQNAFRRNAKLDADELKVSTSHGTVKLEGVVSSWSEHDQALAAAWSAPGVTDVDDHILVAY
jgi:osmotically-inducible protein OsmY